MVYSVYMVHMVYMGGGGPSPDSVVVTNINVMLNVVILGMFFTNSIEMFQKNIYGTYLYNSLVFFFI